VEWIETAVGDYNVITKPTFHRFYCTTRLTIRTKISKRHFWVLEGWCWCLWAPRRSRPQQEWGKWPQRAGIACCERRISWETCSATRTVTACPSADKTSPHITVAARLSTTQTTVSQFSHSFVILGATYHWNVWDKRFSRRRKCRCWSSGLYHLMD
jgi:hypothetical protein